MLLLTLSCVPLNKLPYVTKPLFSPMFTVPALLSIMSVTKKLMKNRHRSALQIVHCSGNKSVTFAVEGSQEGPEGECG